MAEYISIFPPKPVLDKKAHLQRCARGAFADKLRNAGFVCYNNEDLSWYKVVNHEVLLSVYLYSDFPIMPLLLMVGYGIHPLFIPAPIPQKIIVREPGFDSQIMSAVYVDTPRKLYDKNTLVQCPATPECGAEQLDEIVFPKFQQVHSIEDAYAIHKAFYQNYIAQFQRQFHTDQLPNYITSTEFIDEAIFLNDKSMYSICIAELNRRYKVLLGIRSTTSVQKQIASVQLQIDAIQNGKREEYLDVLEARKKRFVRKLEQKVGIQV